MPSCAECGYSLREGAQFCASCGHPVAAAATGAAVLGATEPPGPPSGPAPVGGAAGGDRNQKLIIGLLAALVVAVVAVGVVLVAGGGGGGGGGDDESSKKDREVLLEAAASAGPAPFTPDLQPVSATLPTTTPPTTVPGATVPGNTGRAAQGPFGGTGDNSLCDRELLIEFLTTPGNAGIAREWARVLDIEVADIPAYVRALVPTTLTADARVTNHTFENGRAVGYQAVLQAGTAVLVDTNGRLIARCRCGNPLLAPQEVSKPIYTGPKWEGFDPTVIVVVVPSPTPIYPPGGAGTLPQSTTPVRDRSAEAIARVRKAYEACARRSVAIQDGLMTAANLERVLGEASYTVTPVDPAAGVYRVTLTLQPVGPFKGGAVIVGQSQTWEVDLGSGALTPSGGAQQPLQLADACGGAALNQSPSTTTTTDTRESDAAVALLRTNVEACYRSTAAAGGGNVTIDGVSMDAFLAGLVYQVTPADVAGTYRVVVSYPPTGEAATFGVTPASGEITPLDATAAEFGPLCSNLA